MRAGFEQVGVRIGEQSDLAHAAGTIVAAYRIRELTAMISGADVANDVWLCEQCAIVGDYGRWLDLGVLRKEKVYDAKVLSNSKDAIGHALKQCAALMPLSKEEVASLGDMYCCLAYFHERWESSENGDDGELFVRSVAEGQSRRSEWNAQFAESISSKLSALISSWLKPNA